MIAGNIYGVVLNDAYERTTLAHAFSSKLYMAPPLAPVIYIKPRGCVRVGGAGVPMPADVPELEIAPTLALLFARDTVSCDTDALWSTVGGACLALDVSVPQSNYYRPAISQRCRDGFLPLGDFGPAVRSAEIITSVDGAEVHRWSLERLVRDVSTLIRELAGFMTLRAGDVLLVGLPGDAPRAGAGQYVRVEAYGLSPLSTTIMGANL